MEIGFDYVSNDTMRKRGRNTGEWIMVIILMKSKGPLMAGHTRMNGESHIGKHTRA
jgi:hypothetical protein